nr:1-acyl-sn-glycerol-3-phosphate acyltransferase [Bacillota bacterium]
MWYRLARVVVRLFFRIVYRWRVYGVEHVPATGPVLLCSNHISLLDPPLVAAPLNRRVSFMAKEQLFRIPVL